jgi:hypothetical protein
MRLFLKIVVYCIMLINTHSNNLKQTNTLSNQQIFSNIMEVNNLNKTKKFQTNIKEFKEKELKLNIYALLFKEVNDKTFICITLLYFQTKTVYLILTALLTKLMIIYLKILIGQYSLLQTIPSELFQVLSIFIYNLSGFAILYKLMFVNLKENNSEFFKKKNEESDKIVLFDFQSIFKTFGVVFITQFAAYSINETNFQNLNPDNIFFSWNFLTINILKILFGIFIAMIIGYISFKKFSLEFNLIISAITFLLLGVDDLVKFFSVYNEWQG